MTLNDQCGGAGKAATSAIAQQPKPPFLTPYSA
jgi:hypothetical protein